MNILSKIASWVVSKVVNWIPGGYDGARRYSPDRSVIPGWAQDARYDIDPFTRLELVHKSRYWERNGAIPNRLGDLFEQFTVGPTGLRVISSTESEEDNALLQTWWDEWCRVPDLTSLQNFGTIQSLIDRTWFFDGECFIRKVSGKTPMTVKGEPQFRPRIQLLETHRIETPGHLVGNPAYRIIDGVEVDLFGRPVAYWHRKGTITAPTYLSPGTEDSYERIPADEIIHLFEPSRIGQMRGLPFLYAVMEDLHKLDDLQLLELRAAMDAAEKSTVVTTKSGELSVEGLKRNRLNKVVATSATNVDTLREREQWVKQSVGGRTLALREGETLQQFTPNRPSAETVELWNQLTAKVCAGVGISQLLVFPRSMQGTVVRSELSIANAFFQARSQVIQAAVERIYVWVMGWAIRFDARLDGIPDRPDSLACITRPPRQVDVDTGYNSAATIAELQAGSTTYEHVYATRGMDWKREIKQSVKEAAYFLRCCQEEKVDPAIARPAIAAAIMATLQQQQADNAAADEQLTTA